MLPSVVQIAGAVKVDMGFEYAVPVQLRVETPPRVPPTVKSMEMIKSPFVLVPVNRHGVEGVVGHGAVPPGPVPPLIATGDWKNSRSMWLSPLEVILSIPTNMIRWFARGPVVGIAAYT